MNPVVVIDILNAKNDVFSGENSRRTAWGIMYVYLHGVFADISKSLEVLRTFQVSAKPSGKKLAWGRREKGKGYKVV